MTTTSNQTTRKILMTDPIGFCYNVETAVSNAFQKKTTQSESESEYNARKEFHQFVNQLTLKGVDVIIAQGKIGIPDAVFPNNVFSTTHDGSFVYYPMANVNRRKERAIGYDQLLIQSQFQINKINDLTHLEVDKNYLEGTGSMIFHHPSKTLFMTNSIRSNVKALEEFCKLHPHNTIVMDAKDASNQSVYHTNVVLSIGDQWMMACLESLSHPEKLRRWSEENNMTIIEIDLNQMNHFGANVLGVEGKNGPLGVVSATAWNAFSMQQKRAWEKFLEPLIVTIPTIETIGGGSARCMMAEIFLPYTSAKIKSKF